MAYCCSLPIHSIIKKMAVRNNVMYASRISGKSGKVKNEAENISDIKSIAFVTLVDLKKTHATTVNPKVSNMLPASFNEGINLPCATTSRWFLLVLKRMDGIMYKAFRKPHMMNVQFAPCQKPLPKNMMNVFRTFIHVPPLLPPKGMQR